MPPLTPEQLAQASARLDGLTQKLEKTILDDICRRIAKAGMITDSAEWQMLRLKEMGLANNVIEQAVADYTKMSSSEIQQLFHETAQVSDDFYSELYTKSGKQFVPLEENPFMQQLITAGADQTQNELVNLTRSMGFSVRQPDGTTTFKPAAKAYQSSLDLAQMQVATGTFDYTTAIRNSVKTLTDSGLCFVDYASGHRNRADVAVRRAVLTGLSQMSGQISKRNAEELETDIVEVTAHAGARPSHAEWQGKWYSLSGKSSKYPSLEEATGYGTGDGLKGWNCRHDFYPVVEGVSVPTYTPEQLENIDPPPIEYNGKTLTYYECTQKQRTMETAMRKTKREIIAAKASGDEDMFTAKSILLRRQKEEYAKFSKSANMLTQNERAQVYGFDRSISAKAAWAVKKAQNTSGGSPAPASSGGKAVTVDVPVPASVGSGKVYTGEKIMKPLDNSGGNGIIGIGSENVALEYQRYGRNKDTLVNKTYIDSGEYRRKFDNLTDNPTVNKVIYDKAKEALKHRSGTVLEDMYWFDSVTGNVVSDELNSQTERRIVYSKKTSAVVNSYEKNTLITLHTHPSSMPPSVGDLNACYRNGYKCGFIACHNGKIFGYTANEEINENLYSSYIANYLNQHYSEYDAQLLALKELKKNYQIDFWEVE